ncbi:MAG: cation:dicarboxylase symporter family transporter, partial [Terricaulis sp.]
MKSISIIVLLSLVAGLVAGALVRSSGDPTLANIASVIEPFGGLWLNTLRMTVVPLVVSLLITAIASVADTAKTGGLVARAIGL